ncbi:tRNA (adenosine(37)-N6)-dimethylallyltransferase MiaA [Psychroserpens sp.]|uniref:tRNA (adenosine(37)-N6)-dimethylallyltransferase MiaA n=1 Tax=Psychroserpens sp. TaxID=2020870 RepID=UPI001B04093C|nr:tRNA (adenosine(37)-N6)-dimethylallyltransferase MiaA [Psychroserpens sp.]MBO6606787.1 tRNA (adenosine(37)-N6)-dimethylallyltransferase MiaA [Psychroserpens sp.]MBO6631188.1 tRNA (adenosine(37)-N6)-dimethylallyltransferase MiaA [Psychroserpens sp.]MBO6653490.1 tRNA (adenosine(37)-N6)-dimethylallyltransferase MiaA [Psychroserpens sp.]MBO6680482.1 tRNA (adenosine(37)-N6)-dimethylallyltransferase MiaA [Psychroserpens sp.]MBO6750559.1 tRNA (adenosine(37)-N6)-dimethylallyltransferase MiaA [Psych
MTKYLISIVGPTAIGKTALSIKLAQHYQTEIISADSRQFYKEMSIGTAVPTPTELSAAAHHFIQHISVTSDYNVGAFEKDAMQQLKLLFRKHDVVIMVGGSGLYVKAVTEGLDEFPEVDSNIREQLNEQLKSEGIKGLQQQLKQLDPTAYQTIAIDNPHRVIRALEVSIGSGKPYSSFLGAKHSKRDFETISIGLMADRQLIYDRINSRVDQMIANGLLNEVKKLKDLKHLNALNTVGYKELFKHIYGEWDLEFAISEIKKNTRRFAKRQMTWFKKDQSIHWFDYDTNLSEIVDTITKQIQK